MFAATSDVFPDFKTLTIVTRRFDRLGVKWEQHGGFKLEMIGCSWRLPLAIAVCATQATAAHRHEVPPIATAIESSPENTTEQESAVARSCKLSALTPLSVRVDARLDSRTTKAGEVFPISVGHPVTVQPGFVLPSGVRGEGVVLHAARKGGGRSGELSLVARSFSLNGVSIPLRSFSLTSLVGRTETTTSDMMIISVAGAFVVVPAGEHNKTEDVRVAIGSFGTAKVAKDVLIPCRLLSPADAGPLERPSTIVPQSTAGTTEAALDNGKPR